MSTGAIVAGTLAGSLGGAALSGHAAGEAASDQSSAAEQAAQLQYKASQNALGFQEQQWNQSQQNLAPWLQSGTGALSNLDYLLGNSPQTSGQFQGQASPTGSQQSAPGGPGTTAANAFQTVQANNGAMPHESALGINPGGSLAGGNNIAANPTHVTTGMTLSGAQPQQATPASPSAISPEGNGISGTPATGAASHIGAAGNPSISGAPSSGGYGSLLQPYPGQFSAPTAQQLETNDPGYQARLQLGQDALQRSAAASGGVLTGGTAQALNNEAQDYASNEYNNYYNQSYNTYASNYNQYQQQQANEYNRLASLAGVGQTAAVQLGPLGQSASNAVGSNLTGTAAAMGRNYQNAAAANASGVVGAANAYSGAIGNAGSSLSQLAILQQLYGGGGASGYSSADAASQGLGSFYE